MSEQKTNNNVISTLREVQVQNLSFYSYPARSAEKILKYPHKQTNKEKTNKQTRKQTNKQTNKQKKQTHNNNNNNASGAPGGLEKQISSYTLSLSGVKKRRPTNKVLWEQTKQ